MASPKLFDYNSSFGLLRANPKLTGNVKVSVDSSGGVWLNSFNANPTLSSNRFKKFQVTGEDSYATDLYNFFEKGTIGNDLIFQVGQFTDGNRKAVEDFESQYDFFYGSGASTLIDKNYQENFTYLQPLWLRDQLPEFFVIFKVSDPISYPYTTNVSLIETGKEYKLIQDPDSDPDDTFTISYGKDNSGNDVVYADGDIFTGVNVYTSYSVLSGSGKVAEMNEIKYQPQVDDVESFFNSKILPNSSVVATYDLRAETKIGKYIRSIVNNKNYKQAPINFSFQNNTYTYYNGVSIKDGVFTERGELLYDYLVSPQSSVQSDFEEYVTDGFQRNGIISPNVLNMEYLFNDTDSDLYTINRYYGFYVSKNDLGEFFLNGDYFYKFKNGEGNLNLPKPSRNNLGYYNDNKPNFQSSTGGVRLYYEGASGWVPGSYDTNVNDPQKLYYITDKSDNFYSLKRFENYNSTTKIWEDNTPEYAKYGPYNGTSFGTTGNPSLDTGTLVIANRSVNLQNFTGVGDKIGSIKGTLTGERGRSNIGIEFLNNIELDEEVVFKIFWPNGTMSESAGKYDLVKSGEFGGTLVGWGPGSSYNTGNNHYFNGLDGTTEEIASSFSDCISSISDVVWNSAPSSSTSVIRTKASGKKLNSQFKVVVYDDYAGFTSSYMGVWNNTSGYSTNNVVLYANTYYKAKNNISPATPGSPYKDPSLDTSNWETYSTFSQSGYIKIAGKDVSTLNGIVDFEGGTDYPLSRVAFDIKEKDKVVAGTFIEVSAGTGVTGSSSMVESVTNFVDNPFFGTNGKVEGFGGYNELLIANLKDEKAVISLGTSQSFNLFDMPKIETGVFTFFDVKDFDFDFWSSAYSETPTSEYHRYFQLIPERAGQIKTGVKYIVQSGEITVDVGTMNERIINAGNSFIGSSVDSFLDTGFTANGVDSIVLPAIFTQIGWKDTSTYYNPKSIKAEQNLDSFDGFYGIQSISETSTVSPSNDKDYIFNYGKLDTEYQYLEENYTTSRANRSKIVPYINKWGYFGGTDARGNKYRLNSSPAFSPTNFSPSFEREIPDPMYLTHEWMLLEGVPDGYPVDKIEGQNSYLPGKIDLSKVRSANPSDSLYFSSFFTVDPSDYSSPYNDPSNTTKELFTPFRYNNSTGFYDTIFRGAKISLRRRSAVSNPQSDLDKYVPNFRGFEDYKFASVLRVVPEDTTSIQSPVSYEIIENTQQKSVLFICSIVIKDYRALPLGYTGGTGGNPFVDYLLLYSLSDKKKDSGVGATGSTGATGTILYEIDNIKLSAALDLSMSSQSSVTQFTNPGFIYTIPNPEYDTDLREEINVIYPVGGTGSLSSTGKGSFDIPAISSTYPWPVGRSKNLASFGPVGTNYNFSIPFAFSSPVTVPIGPRSAYENNPVFQIEGGEKYFDFIMRRISLSQISDRVNDQSPFIKYRTYSWNETTQTTDVRSGYFEIYMTQPTALFRPSGTYPVNDFSGPQTLGQNQPTGYQINVGGAQYASDILRYSGIYEPLFRKIIKYKNDKTDTISGYSSADLSYRNCTFAPEKMDFGKVKNLNYSKVSLGKNILEGSENLPLGPVYPLVGETPIDRKDFSIFLSTWDPGYFNLYASSTQNSSVAGTRSMREKKSFFGSKMMQTPYDITSYTFITLEVNRTTGETDIQKINEEAKSSLVSIQNITPQTSNTGIGQLGSVLSNVDLPVFDEGIFPDVEVFWQKNERTNTLNGSIRLDRILRRYLLNAGVSKVFVDNIISEFGVGDPENINDDIKTYIDKNIVPIYEGITFDFFVKKTGTELSSTEILLRGDLISPDRIRYSYYSEPDYNLTKRNALSYTFEFPLEAGKNYSTTFSFQIRKI
jgi:hypothetical protein